MTQSTELRELASLLRVHDGNVGIGPLTANPPYTLSLGQTNVAGAHTIRLAGNGNPKHEIQFREAGTTYGFTFRYAGDVADNKLHIVQHENDANGTEVMTFMRDSVKVGIGADSPTATLQVGNLVSGETGNVIINSEGGNPVGLKVASRTNRARIQVADNDTSGFIIAEGSIFSLGFADQASDNNVNITNAYDVGIGTQTPAHKLDVVGAIGASQVRHSIRPTLNLDFANSKELDSRITFYRDSIATYYDSKGVLKYANNNEPRFDHDPVTGESKGLLIEEERTNIAIGSTTLGLPIDFNGMYNITNTRLAPDGTMSATDVIAFTGVSRHEVNVKYPGISGNNYTTSFYVKPLGAVTHMSVSRAGGSDNCNFDIVNMTHATPGGNAVVSITDAGNDWRRVTFRTTETATGTRSTYISPGIGATSSSVYNNLNGDGANGLALWGCQVEVGDFPTSFMPLDTRFFSRSSVATYHDETGILRTAPVDAARYGYKYDGRKWIESGLIVEASSTNLFPESDNFETPSGSWAVGRQNISIVKDSTGNPDGTKITRFMNATSAAGAWILKDSSLSSSVNYTTSMYVKQKTSGINFQIAPSTGFSSTYQNFDLSTGQLGSGNLSGGARAIIENVGNGWYRCSVTHNATATYGRMAMAMVNGDGGRLSTVPINSQMYIFGAQMEQSHGPTSFIYTKGSTETRSTDILASAYNNYTRKADDAYIDDIQNYYWYSHDSGTLFAEHNVDRDIDGSAWGIVTLENEGSSDNYVGLRYRSSGTSGEVLNNNGISQISASAISAADLNYFNKGAIAYETNSAAAVGNGGTVSTDSSVTVPNLTRITIGTGYGIGYIGGHIKKIAYYPERLSNGEITALTENN